MATLDFHLLDLLNVVDSTLVQDARAPTPDEQYADHIYQGLCGKLDGNCPASIPACRIPHVTDAVKKDVRNELVNHGIIITWGYTYDVLTIEEPPVAPFEVETPRLPADFQVQVYKDALTAWCVKRVAFHRLTIARWLEEFMQGHTPTQVACDIMDEHTASYLNAAFAQKPMSRGGQLYEITFRCIASNPRLEITFTRLTDSNRIVEYDARRAALKKNTALNPYVAWLTQRLTSGASCPYAFNQYPKWAELDAGMVAAVAQELLSRNLELTTTDNIVHVTAVVGPGHKQVSVTAGDATETAGGPSGMFSPIVCVESVLLAQTTWIKGRTAEVKHLLDSRRTHEIVQQPGDEYVLAHMLKEYPKEHAALVRLL